MNPTSTASTHQHGSSSTASIALLARPSSSASLRPSSSASLRPSSSASLRPSSSASIRPTSRTSYRPKSRLQKLTTAKLLPFCEDIVRRVLSEPSGDDSEAELKYHEMVGWSVKQLSSMESSSNKAALTMDMDAADRAVRGHIEKARIKSQDVLATALDKSYGQLKEWTDNGEGDLDDEIKKSRLPAHIQLILALSSPPQQSTLTHASLYLDALSDVNTQAKKDLNADQLLWKEILEEDPYEGDHWIGVPGGIPLPTKRKQRRNQDGNDLDLDDDMDTSPSLSPLNSDDLALDDILSDSDSDSSLGSHSRPRAPAPEPAPATASFAGPARRDSLLGGLRHGDYRPMYTTYAYRKELEDLKAKQYWLPGWEMDAQISIHAQVRGTFNIGNASTLGPTLQRVLPNSPPPVHQLPLELVLSSQRYIQEQDAVREVLIALQGRDNILFDREFKTTKSTPKLLHLSLASQQSLLDALGRSCWTVQQLRRFTGEIFSRSPALSGSGSKRVGTRDKEKITQSLEAFADAIDAEIRLLEIWCARREEAWLRALGGVVQIESESAVIPGTGDVIGAEQALVVSLLGTEKAFRDRFEDSFQVLLDVVVGYGFQGFASTHPSHISDSSDTSNLPSHPSDPSHLSDPSHHSAHRSPSPSQTTAHLLDTLFFSAQSHLERGNSKTGETVMKVFVKTAELVWGMVGSWIRIGFENSSSSGDKELEEEFFIESNGLGIDLGYGVVGLLDPDFWQEGYGLRDEGPLGSSEDDDLESASTRIQTGIPSFLKHVAQTVLESGKAMGLLKALGVDVDLSSLEQSGHESFVTEARVLRDLKREWVSFARLVEEGSNLGHGASPSSPFDLGKIATTATDTTGGGGGDSGNSLFSVSIDRLSQLTYDKLTPYAQASGALLAKVVVEQCDFWSHLRAIESLYLMQRGDIISDFSDALFAKMDSKQNWTDFHFLNTAFSDIVSASNSVSSVSETIPVPLIRLSYRGSGLAGSSNSNKSIRTVKVLEGLFLEYAIPFPLTYIFTPANLQVYGEIFVFLMQIRRAKSVLEKILVRGAGLGLGLEGRGKPELKAFYAMRSRLSWFINAFLNFITTYVIQTQVRVFHKVLTEDKSKSFDQMIRTHEEHLKKMQSRCLLQSKAKALYRAILSILDMALTFSDLFSAFAGDATMHDISSHSVVLKLKHHRSRRQRRRRKNVIGFGISVLPGSSSSESDSDVDYDHGETDYDSYSVSMNAATVAESDDLFTKVGKMSADLDGLVRFVRRGIETLAGGTGDASATFGVLAFTLEDWDL